MENVIWLGARIIGMIYYVLGTIFGYFVHPNPCRSDQWDMFQTLLGFQLGGWAVYNARSEKDVPPAIAEGFKRQAKILIIGVVILIILTVSKVK